MLELMGRPTVVAVPQLPALQLRSGHSGQVMNPPNVRQELMVLLSIFGAPPA